ncbi:DUF2756 domain-containing protein [Apirhabdus apintestini]|nr:DUF2756 domain-containing protein [Enterobacteriaceae bacterium CA-0114]
MRNLHEEERNVKAIFVIGMGLFSLYAGAKPLTAQQMRNEPLLQNSSQQRTQQEMRIQQNQQQNNLQQALRSQQQRQEQRLQNQMQTDRDRIRQSQPGAVTSQQRIMPRAQ